MQGKRMSEDEITTVLATIPNEWQLKDNTNFKYIQNASKIQMIP
jgi:hypothetical protein